MNRLTSKLSIIILYYVKLFATLHNLISSLYKYIYDKYIYIYIYKLSFSIKSNFILMSLITNKLLCLSLARLIIEPKLEIDLAFFTK